MPPASHINDIISGWRASPSSSSTRKSPQTAPTSSCSLLSIDRLEVQCNMNNGTKMIPELLFRGASFFATSRPLNEAGNLIHLQDGQKMIPVPQPRKIIGGQVEGGWGIGVGMRRIRVGAFLAPGNQNHVLGYVNEFFRVTSADPPAPLASAFSLTLRGPRPCPVSPARPASAAAGRTGTSDKRGHDVDVRLRGLVRPGQSGLPDHRPDLRPCIAPIIKTV